MSQFANGVTSPKCVHNNVCIIMTLYRWNNGRSTRFCQAACGLLGPSASAISLQSSQAPQRFETNSWKQLGVETVETIIWGWKQASSLLPSLSLECLEGNLCNNWQQHLTTTGKELSVALRTTELIGPKVSPQVKSGSRNCIVVKPVWNHCSILPETGGIHWHSSKIGDWFLFGLPPFFIHVHTFPFYLSVTLQNELRSQLPAATAVHASPTALLLPDLAILENCQCNYPNPDPPMSVIAKFAVWSRMMNHQTSG